MQQATRALIVNKNKQMYMVIHHYSNPRNQGKWSTVGGRIEKHDASEVACLEREFKEEFGEKALSKIRILDKVAVLDWTDEFMTGNTVRHHFYHVEYDGEELIPNEPDEIIKGKFLDWAEIQEIKSQGKMFFGCEDQYFAQIIGMTSQT